MLKNNQRQRAVGDGAAASSKLDINLGIGNADKAPPTAKVASSLASPAPASASSTPASPPPPASSSLASPAPASSLTASKPAAATKSSPATADQTKLSGLKQQALAKLSPLVEDLDQPPLEHFRTLMMLIQATDNTSLLSRALETAGSIDNDKERAQALLDVVNEINYFTAQADKNKPAPK